MPGPKGDRGLDGVPGSKGYPGRQGVHGAAGSPGISKLQCVNQISFIKVDIFEVNNFDICLQAELVRKETKENLVRKVNQDYQVPLELTVNQVYQDHLDSKEIRD